MRLSIKEKQNDGEKCLPMSSVEKLTGKPRRRKKATTVCRPGPEPRTEPKAFRDKAHAEMPDSKLLGNSSTQINLSSRHVCYVRSGITRTGETDIAREQTGVPVLRELTFPGENGDNELAEQKDDGLTCNPALGGLSSEGGGGGEGGI